MPTPLSLTKTPLPRVFRGVEFWGAIVGRRELKEKEPSTGSTQGVIGPNCSSNQTQPNQDNRSTRWIRKIEDGNLPEKAKEQILLGRPEVSHRATKLETKEDHGDIRIKARGNFQIKHPSPSH